MKLATIKCVFKNPLILSLFIILSLGENIKSQENDLSAAYYNAVNLYNMGKIDTAYNILTSSLSNKQLLKKTDNYTKANIYRLNALSCIFLEKQDEAKYYVKKMLAHKPHYKNNFREGDLLEFRRMVDEFTVLPSIVIGVEYFKNYSTISIEKNLTTHKTGYIPDITDFREYGGGVFFEYGLTKRLSAGIGLNLFKVMFTYTGAVDLLSSNINYDLNFRYVETPVYVNYKLRADKKLKPYFQLTLVGRYYPKQKDTYNVPHRFKSTDYGRYYIQEENANGQNAILAIFFQKYEYFDMIAGGGINYCFKNACLDLNIGYTPFQINTDPLKDVDNINDVSDAELFKSADETIVVDIRKYLRFTLSYKFFLKYKAF